MTGITGTFTLNSPLTKEDWDKITDVDFDNTRAVTFHTKHGKEVEFLKVVRCKDCKYRPYLPKECDPDESDGLDLVFPFDGKCPCECEDGWYSHIPEDDWFCANGKRKGESE